MAALTKSGVTVNDFWFEGDRVGSKRKVVDATLVLSSQGGLSNNVPATLFGLSKITKASGFRDSNSVAVAAGPSWNGALLVFYTVETNGNPADKTATVRGLVSGLE